VRIVYLADAPYIHTTRWVQHFARLGHDLHVVSFRPAEIEGATVHHVGGFEPLRKLRYLVHARRVAAVIRRLRPDLLHALHLTSYGFLGALTGVKPYVISVWGTDVLEAPTRTPLHRFLTNYGLAKADAITATGLRLAEATLPYVERGKGVTVVPYGVDLERFTPEPRVEKPRVTVGATSRFSPEKGLPHLLRATAMLRDRGVDIDVVLAGEGPSQRRLEQLTRQLGLEDRVRFPGWLQHNSLPGLLQQYDIFTMPSTKEGFGVSAVEASAMELPVVASRVHGIPDVVIDGETGILVPPADERALAAAIERLVRDAELRRRMGCAGRAFVERNYRWQDNTALMERLYEEMTGVRPPVRTASGN